MGVNSLPKTVTGQRRDCDLNPGPSAPESSTLTTWLPSHPGHTSQHYSGEYFLWYPLTQVVPDKGSLNSGVCKHWVEVPGSVDCLYHADCWTVCFVYFVPVLVVISLSCLMPHFNVCCLLVRRRHRLNHERRRTADAAFSRLVDWQTIYLLRTHHRPVTGESAQKKIVYFVDSLKFSLFFCASWYFWLVCDAVLVTWYISGFIQWVLSFYLPFASTSHWWAS